MNSKFSKKKDRFGEKRSKDNKKMLTEINNSNQTVFCQRRISLARAAQVFRVMKYLTFAHTGQQLPASFESQVLTDLYFVPVAVLEEFEYRDTFPAFLAVNQKNYQYFEEIEEIEEEAS